MNKDNDKDIVKAITVGLGVAGFFTLFLVLGYLGGIKTNADLAEQIASEPLGANGYPIRELYITETVDGLVCATTYSPYSDGRTGETGQDYRRGISCDWASYNARAK